MDKEKEELLYFRNTGFELLKEIEEYFNSIQEFKDLECFFDDPDSNKEVRELFKLRKRIRFLLKIDQ